MVQVSVGKPSGLEFDPEARDRPTPDEASLKRKLQGVLLLRLLLAVFFLALTLLVQSLRAEDLLSVPLRPLYYFSVALLLLTIVAALSLRRVRNLREFAYLQLLFDAGAVTFLVYLSGGVESPFSFLYMPAIISGAVLLHRRGSMVSATACALSYGLLLDLQYFGWIAPLQVVGAASQVRDSGAYFLSILMNIAGFYLTAYLSGYLAEQLRRSSQQAREHKRDFLQLEMLHRNIIQSISSGILIVSPNGHVLFSNASAQKILALTPAQIDHQPLERIVPTLDFLTWSGGTPPAAPPATQALARREVTYRRPGGEELCLGYSVSFLRRGQREHLGLGIHLPGFDPSQIHGGASPENGAHGFMPEKWRPKLLTKSGTLWLPSAGPSRCFEARWTKGSFHAKLMNIVAREIQRIDDLITDFLWLAKGSQKSEKIEEVEVCAIIEEVLVQLKAEIRIRTFTGSKRYSRPCRFSLWTPSACDRSCGISWSMPWRQCPMVGPSRFTWQRKNDGLPGSENPYRDH